MMEMEMPKSEVAIWAWENWQKTGRWTRKRWRVEGSPAGSSKFLTRKAAEDAQQKYGGWVVRLLPDTPTSEQLFIDAAKGLAACRCGAAASQPCRKIGRTGAARMPHKSRTARGGR